MNSSPSIDWLSWSEQAFARAAAEHKPVLLFISATWCHWCHVMETTGFARRDVAALVERSFIPVRVDADRHPDISERYSLGGWPTTAFLTADGEVLGGGTYFAPQPLFDLLTQVTRSFETRQSEIVIRASLAAQRRAAQTHPHVGAGTEPLAESLAWLRARILEEHDAEYGGFGVEPKYPHVAALSLALEMSRDARDEPLLAVVSHTLDAMGWGGLYDDVDGGFFRYATTRDWMLPHSEKLLEDNAALLTLYADASAVLQHRPYRNKAIDVLRYVHATLADPVDCVFFPSQRADERYYAATSPEGRSGAQRPAVDRAIYVDVNGAMISAYLHAAGVLGDRSLAEFAIDALDRLLSLTYLPGAGVAHSYDGEARIRGLLGDQVRASAALLDAYAASERLPYLMLSEELMRYAIRTMWDERAGGFVDREAHGAADIGLLREAHKPLALNCEAARVLHRLAILTEQAELRERAAETLASQATQYRAHGLWGAPYGLAALALHS